MNEQEEGYGPAFYIALIRRDRAAGSGCGTGSMAGMLGGG